MGGGTTSAATSTSYGVYFGQLYSSKENIYVTVSMECRSRVEYVVHT